uniref:Uncharacterized protein n=1 Tax=Glossina pallidipes TaxID=7398 RepID=A0A1B0A1E9_GLOPL
MTEYVIGKNISLSALCGDLKKIVHIFRLIVALKSSYKRHVRCVRKISTSMTLRFPFLICLILLVIMAAGTSYYPRKFFFSKIYCLATRVDPTNLKNSDWTESMFPVDILSSN